MLGSKKFLSSVLLAIAYATVTSAFQAKEAEYSHSTHRVRHISRDLKIEAYHPESTFEV